MATHLQATKRRDMATEADAEQEKPFPASTGLKKVSDPGFRAGSLSVRELYYHFYVPLYLPNKEAFDSGIMGLDDVIKHRLKYEAEKKEAEERKLALIKQLEHLLKDEPSCKKPKISVGTEDEDEDEDEENEEEDEEAATAA